MNFYKALFATCLAGSLALFAQTAEAQQQAASCGGIYFDSSTTCEIAVEGGCEVMCTPVSFTAGCSADLYVACDGGCDASFEASCTASCTADCMASCEVEPAMFDCRADCTANIMADCSAQCSAEVSGSDAEAQCRASCETTFNAECDASCEATPPMADCMASCNASCEGSCTAEANVDCQIDCQADGYVDCYADVMGGCEGSCMEPTGALFCDGQYVDASNIEMCIAELASFEIMTDSSATSMCDDTGCSAEAEASVGCSAAPGTSTGNGWLALLALPMLALFRRRQG